MAKDKWVSIGVVAVDSGQLMICDPSYIDSLWEKKEFVDIRLYQDINTKKIYKYGQDFTHFESNITGYNETPNQLIEEGVWKEIDVEHGDGFSYNEVSHQNDEGYKQINFDLGHPGLAVSFRSGLGDGLYEVSAKIGMVDGLERAGERIKEVRIKLI